MTATAASWAGAVKTVLYEENGIEMTHIRLKPWHGQGISKTLYCGPVAEYKPSPNP